MPLPFYNTLLDTISNHTGDFLLSSQKNHTYQDLFQWMLRLNTRLSCLRQAPVAVLCNKSIEAYAAVYATVLSNNIWLPLSPQNPPDRNLQILKQAKPKVLLCDRDLPQDWKDALSGVTEIVEFKNLSTKATFFSNLPESEDDIAYLLFTSGSSGVPKGVPMSHLNYHHFIERIQEILPLEEGEIFSDFHDHTFDISIFYLFCAVLKKGSLVTANSPSERMFPIPLLRQMKVTVWSTVPSTIESVRRVHEQKSRVPSLKILFVCGEPFRLDLLDFVFKNIKSKWVYNFYGLTETGVENFYHRCRKQDVQSFAEEGFAPIGTPIKGSQAKIVGGELWLSGVQNLREYFGGIQKDRFVNENGETWFRTGDIVKIVKGRYFCKGRMDAQIKIQGYRVELMDIECKLRGIEGIEEAVCFQHPVSRALVAVIQTQLPISRETVIKSLEKLLPKYMIPRDWFFENTFPRNKNGKLDRFEITSHVIEAGLHDHKL